MSASVASGIAGAMIVNTSPGTKDTALGSMNVTDPSVLNVMLPIDTLFLTNEKMAGAVAAVPEPPTDPDKPTGKVMEVSALAYRSSNSPAVGRP